MQWHLKNTPYQVQSEALRLAEGKRGFLYWMDPGTGKTAVILNEFLELRERGIVDTLIVICPNSLKSNWATEARTWGTGLDLAVWKGSDLTVKEGFICNYESIARGEHAGKGAEVILRILSERKVFLCLDEIHKIKSPKAAVTKFVLKNLIRYPEILRGLSGSPFGNSVMDLYPQLRFVGEIAHMNPYSFRNRFALLGGFMSKQVIGINPERREELTNLLHGCSFRARKEDWLDLPEKIYKSIDVEMPEKLKKYYEEMRKKFVISLADQDISAQIVIVQAQKLSQISSGFITDSNKEAQVLHPFTDSPKYKALLDVIDETPDKLIVFCHYKYTVTNLITSLEKELKEKVAFIRGGMSVDELEENKALFNSDAGSKVIVVQSATGKEGHTLLGGPDIRCSTTVFYENTYSLIVRTQCEDRSHRIGQRSNVLIIDLLTSDIERVIMGAIKKKKNLSDVIIDLKEMDA